MIDPFEKMNYNKKSMLALFVTMSKSDHDIDENEEIFIEEMREKLGVSKEELKHIWENEDAYPLNPPKSEKLNTGQCLPIPRHSQTRAGLVDFGNLELLALGTNNP